MKDLRPTGFHKQRRTKNWTDYEHDAYKAQRKLPEPTLCSICGAVYHKGRWQWIAAPQGAQEVACPACRRIQDGLPGGYVTLSGRFLGDHKDEIVELMKNTEAREKAEHALQRIIAIDEQRGEIEVTTTDNHLARALGEAVRHAYQGELHVHYSKEEDLARVTWSRED